MQVSFTSSEFEDLLPTDDMDVKLIDLGPQADGQPARPAWESVLALVEVQTGVSRAAMLGRSRKPEASHARQAAWWLMRHLSDLSLPQIADIFVRDHSTIIYGIRQVDRRLKKRDYWWTAMIGEITRRLTKGQRALMSWSCRILDDGQAPPRFSVRYQRPSDGKTFEVTFPMTEVEG